jgi:hypothetical protein
MSPRSGTAKGSCSPDDLQSRAGGRSPVRVFLARGGIVGHRAYAGLQPDPLDPDPPGAPDDLIACQQSLGHGPTRLHSGCDPRRPGRQCRPEVLRRYDVELDAAFVQAREDGDLAPLLETVRRWWFEADAWRDPDAQREYLARVERYQREGPPPPSERVSWQEIRAKYGL